MQAFASFLVHAVYLLALALAPPFVSPAPAPAPGWLPGVAAGLVLAALVVVAGLLRVRLGGRGGLAASLLIGAAAAVALIAGDVFRGDHGPLGRGVFYVAIPLWAGLVVVGGAVAARRFGAGAHRARLAAMGAVVLACAALYGSSMGRLASPERMWLAALRHDGDDAVAVEALVHAKKHAAALEILDRCVAVNRGACACLARRVTLIMRTPQARDEALSLRARCPASVAAQAAALQVEALYGDPERAEQEARAGLERGDDGGLRYALALALERGGRPVEAIDEAKRALALGAGRDAALLVGSLAILAGDLDTADAVLRPVVTSDPDDADAQYDLALIADRRDDYNRARQGYLAALRADPLLASARYNLALLTLRRGAVDEARHHVERFAAAFPDDPRGALLARRVATGR